MSAKVSTGDVVHAMSKALRPDEARGLKVVYRFDLSGIGGGTWTVSVANQTCHVSDGPNAPPNVTIRMGGADYLNLAAGKLDAISAFNQGRIQVDGDLSLATKLLDIFQPWAALAQPSPPPSPPKPGPARPPAQSSLGKVVHAMPAGFQPSRAEGLKATFQFWLSGDEGGVWTVVVAGGTCRVSDGAAGNPTAVVHMTGADYLKLAMGNLDAVGAYSQGKIRIEGDVALAGKITDIFRPWAAHAETAPPELPPETPKPEPSPPAPPPAVPPGAPPATGPVAKVQPANIGFEDYSSRGIVYRDRYDEKVASGWTAAIVDEKKGKLHYMDTYTFMRFTQDYYGGGVPERIHGHNSQVLWSTKKFEAGLMQQVQGVTVGGDYGIAIGMLSFWRGPGGQEEPGRIEKMVGIDPTGGRDPRAQTVVWGEADGTDNHWTFPSVAARAGNSTMTLFTMFKSPHDTDGIDINSTYIDGGVMDLAPTTTIETPAQASGAFQVRWGGTAAKGTYPWHIIYYDVDFRVDGGAWQPWKRHTSDTTARFDQATSGPRYTFRGRAWQGGGDTGNRTLPGVWEVSRTTTVK